MAVQTTTAMDFTPTNKNFLNPINFAFILKRAPFTEFFVQKISIPNITLDYIDTPSPQLRLPISASHIDFGQLNVTFKIDESMTNYLEIYNWLVAIGYPFNQTAYAALKANAAASGESLVSDISVIIMDGLKNPNFEIVFSNAFPVELGQISFESTDQNVNFVTTTASFKYSYFDVNKL
jgi:hypothetical protein